jgi:protein phosphatase
VAIGHVGDSRAYRLRRGKLERLTRDHSLVEEMRRKGQLTEAQAEDHPQRSIITRSVGPEPEVEVDLQTVPAQAGDIFLLCSDGLTTMLDDEHVERLLARATSMPNAVRALVDEANRAGGRDNISVIAFKVVDAAEPALDSGAEGATLIGSSAEEAGLTATEVRRRAAADASRQRREDADAARRPGRRRRIVKRVAGLLALLVVIGAIVFGATYGLHHTWFLGTDDAGRVTLYRGVPYELPFGVKLYSEKYSSPVQTESLPEKRKGAVTGQSVRSRDDAVKLLEEIERAQGVTETAAGG